MRRVPILICGLFIFSTAAMFFQNCSGVGFEKDEYSVGAQGVPDDPSHPATFPPTDPPPPQCADISQNVQPTLQWDWYSQLAAYDYHNSSQVMASPTVGDLDGDGHPEVVFVTWSITPADWFIADPTLAAYVKNGVLRIVDGKTGANKVSVGAEALAPLATTTPLLVDLDNDGKMEIVYVHYLQKKVIALNFDGSARWSWDIPATMAYCMQGLSTADTDLNGRAEVIVGNWILEEDGQHQPMLKKTLSPASSAVTCNSLATVLDPAFPQFSIVDPFAVHDHNGNGVFSLSSDNGSIAVGKVRADLPGNQIIKTTSGRLRIFSGTNGNVLSDVNLLALSAFTCPNGSIGGGPASVGDFMGNGTLQIALASGQYIMIFDGLGNLLTSSRTQDCSSEVTGVTAFDFDGDGKPEILYGDEEYLRVYHVVNGQLVVIAKLVNPSGTLYEYPVVADINGDGAAKLLVVSNNYAASGFYNDATKMPDRALATSITGVRAFKSGDGLPWMQTRALWNQYHYNASLVNDHGRVYDPAISSLSWLGRTFKLNSRATLSVPICKK